MSPSKKTSEQDESGFTAEEKAAVKQAAAERRKTAAGKNTGQDVLDAIAAMDDFDRPIAQGLHDLMARIAPELTRRTWYGFPAYARDPKGKDIVVFYQFAGKRKSRYGSIGFNDNAKLDDGTMWPAAYAITEWNDKNEKTLEKLIKKAIG